MKDFYYILGTDANCSFDEIKEAYRKLSKKFHPDLNQEDKYFESRFKEIQQAYETLIDPIKRAKYDEALRKSQPGYTKSGPRQRQYYNAHKSSGKHYQAKSSTQTNFRTRMAIDIIFTILLIFITLVFGDYVYKSMTGGSKLVLLPKTASIVSPLVNTMPKHHKKHHLLKLISFITPSSNSAQAKVSAAIKSSPIIKPDTQKPRPVQTAPIITVSNKTPASPSFLYATYIKANMTGLVNMRETADFGADVIATIPGNSKVFVVEKGNTYYKVVYNNVSGYVPKWSLGAR